MGTGRILTVPSSAIPDSLFSLLKEHLPYSLVILRRLQFAQKLGGTTSQGKVCIASSELTDESGIDSLDSQASFTIAYFDFASGPDTQMYLYSTLQRIGGSVPASIPSSTTTSASETLASQEECRQQLGWLIERMVELRKEYGEALAHREGLLLGSLDSRVRDLLQDMGRVVPRRTGNYDKWLFRLEKIPNIKNQLPDGLRWAEPTLEDCRAVVARADIPRKAESLIRWPCLFVKAGDTPVAWGFLGQDASLSSLHVEPEYRRRGIARLLTAKLFQHKTRLFGNEPWASSDVSADNVASQGVSLSLGGEPGWIVSWYVTLMDMTDHVTTKSP